MMNRGGAYRCQARKLGQLAFMWLAAACGDSEERACIPNETAVCLFAGGGSGVQTCEQDGSGFGPCRVCEPGTLLTCQVPNGGSGTRTCVEDGTGYSECR